MPGAYSRAGGLIRPRAIGDISQIFADSASAGGDLSGRGDVASGAGTRFCYPAAMENVVPRQDFPLWEADEDLIAAVSSDGVPRVRVAGCAGVQAVIGRGGRAEAELDAAALAADSVPVFRRRGGGCAVILDPGNAVVSAVLPAPGVGGITSAFAAVSRWIIAGLGSLGLDGARQEGVSDLAHGDRKIGGSCIYRTRGLLYYSTTLLLDPDLDLVERYLPHPPREPEYRRGRPHRDFMGSIGRILGADALPAFRAGLERVFTAETAPII